MTVAERERRQRSSVKYYRGGAPFFLFFFFSIQRSKSFNFSHSGKTGFSKSLPRTIIPIPSRLGRNQKGVEISKICATYYKVIYSSGCQRKSLLTCRVLELTQRKEKKYTSKLPLFLGVRQMRARGKKKEKGLDSQTSNAAFSPWIFIPWRWGGETCANRTRANRNGGRVE